MNVLKISLCAAVATAALAGASSAFAADGDAIALSYNVGAATDYVFRGVDQTPNTAEAFGGIDATIAKQFYVGTWLSNTGPSGANGVEADFYAGWRPTLGPVSFDLGAIYYAYNDQRLPGNTNNAHNSDYELKAGASIPLGGFTFGVVDFYGPSNNAFPVSAGNDADTNYLEGNVAYTFKNKATLSAAFGNFQASSLGHYNTWNAGVTYPITDHLSIDARYIGTSGSSNLFNGAVGTLKVSF